MAKISSQSKRKEVAKNIEAFLTTQGYKASREALEFFVGTLDKK